MVWKEFSTVVKLHNIVRQSNDEHIFRNVLMSVRQNKLSQEQAIWLQQFQWDNLKRKYGPELTERMETDGLFVFPIHEEEWSHNKSRLLQANRYFPVVKIKATTQACIPPQVIVKKLVVYYES